MGIWLLLCRRKILAEMIHSCGQYAERLEAVASSKSEISVVKKIAEHHGEIFQFSVDRL